MLEEDRHIWGKQSTYYALQKPYCIQKSAKPFMRNIIIYQPVLPILGASYWTVGSISPTQSKHSRVSRIDVHCAGEE